MKQCDHTFDAAGQQLPTQAKARPTIEELREYLDYEPETGVLRWKKTVSSRAQAGAIAGKINNRGYIGVRFRGIDFLGHRVAFALHHGRWPDPQCDHIDCNRLNNRADNLRECSPHQNQHNMRITRKNTSGVKGVSQCRSRRNLWRASVSFLGKKNYKYFRHFEDAAAWVKQLREQLHGEFARH